jgi:hypothetical protein
MDDTMKLQMQLKHRHAEYGSAAFGLHQLETKVVRWVAVAQSLVRSRQIGFGQFPSRLQGGRALHGVSAFLLRVDTAKYCHPGGLPCVQ